LTRKRKKRASFASPGKRRDLSTPRACQGREERKDREVPSHQQKERKGRERGKEEYYAHGHPIRQGKQFSPKEK